MPGMANFLSKAWAGHRRRRGPAREAGRLVIGVLAGLFVLPVLIWIGGQVVLGDYLRDASTGETGGFALFWWDYLRGLAQGSPGHWGAFLGPYLLYAAFRLGNRLLPA